MTYSKDSDEDVKKRNFNNFLCFECKMYLIFVKKGPIWKFNMNVGDSTFHIQFHGYGLFPLMCWSVRYIR